MKITKISIHNFLKLKDVVIDPLKVNVIVGKNKQGKTSILKAIQIAFTGKADEGMIHDAESKAEITIDLDEYKIDRSITRKGNYLTVANKDGWQVPAPQKFLDGLIGQFSFNPIEFFNLKSADKKKYLLQAIDIKLTPEKLNALLGEKVDIDTNKHGLEIISDLYKHYYTQRTQQNATVSRLEKTYDQLFAKLPNDFDHKETGTTLITEAEKIRKVITAQAVNKQKLNGLKDQEEGLLDEIQELELKLRKKNEDLQEIRTQIQAIPETINTTELEKQLANIESRRELITIAKQCDEIMTELTTERIAQEKTDTLVKKLSKDIPEQLVREANLPVEGLKVEENSVTLGGIDIEQLSVSEQLTFALQVVRKLNGEFKIINIDGVEVLDKETFAWFLNEIEKDDFQYFITRVDGDSGLLVEDGKVSIK